MGKNHSSVDIYLNTFRQYKPVETIRGDVGSVADLIKVSEKKVIDSQTIVLHKTR